MLCNEVQYFGYETSACPLSLGKTPNLAQDSVAILLPTRSELLEWKALLRISYSRFTAGDSTPERSSIEVSSFVQVQPLGLSHSVRFRLSNDFDLQ